MRKIKWAKHNGDCTILTSTHTQIEWHNVLITWCLKFVAQKSILSLNNWDGTIPRCFLTFLFVILSVFVLIYFPNDDFFQLENHVTRWLKAMTPTPIRFTTKPRVVRKLDNTIHRINHYPVDSVVCFVNTCPLDSDLSGGQRYPTF